MRRPMRAANARQNGASRITAGMSAIRPRRRKGVFGEALPATLANDSKTNAMTKKTTPGTTDQRTFLGGIGRPESASCTGTAGDGSRRATGGEIRRDDGESHRGTDHDPGKLERADHMVPGPLDRRAVDQPHDESDHGADDRSDDADDGAVGPHDEPHVLCRRTVRCEQAERAQATLREHREPADRDERDEHHPEHRDHGDDRLGVDRVVRRRLGEVFDIRPDRSGRDTRGIKEQLGIAR